MADKKISELTAATTPLAGTEVLPIVQSSSTKKVSVADLTAGRAISASGVGIGTSTLPTGRKLVVDSGSVRLSNDYNLEWGGSSVGVYGNSVSNTLTFFTGSATRITVASDVTVATGNLVIGTSGKGIDFSAAGNAAGMTSELLADYEEGTWTPVLSDASTAGNTATIGTSTGTYTKIGRKVTVLFSLENIDVTGMTSANQLYVQGLPFSAMSGTSNPGAMYVNRISFGTYSWTANIAPSGSTVSFFSPTGADQNAATMKVSNILSATADMYVSLTYFA